MTFVYVFFTAEEQAELQKKHDALKSQVDKCDQQITNLQKHLKEAESILVCVCSWHLITYVLIYE